jgi:tRNA G37 N-methylase Trm5
MSNNEEKQYLKVPKEEAEAIKDKLVSAGLLDEKSEVRWEGDFVSFPLKSGISTDKN